MLLTSFEALQSTCLALSKLFVVSQFGAQISGKIATPLPVVL